MTLPQCRFPGTQYLMDFAHFWEWENQVAEKTRKKHEDWFAEKPGSLSAYACTILSTKAPFTYGIYSVSNILPSRISREAKTHSFIHGRLLGQTQGKKMRKLFAHSQGPPTSPIESWTFWSSPRDPGLLPSPPLSRLLPRVVPSSTLSPSRMCPPRSGRANLKNNASARQYRTLVTTAPRIKLNFEEGEFHNSEHVEYGHDSPGPEVGLLLERNQGCIKAIPWSLHLATRFAHKKASTAARVRI